MAGSGGSAYTTRVGVDSLEELSKKLQADLRKQLRELRVSDVFDDSWVAIANTLHRLGEVTDMERDLPKEDGATLWECEEVTVRFLLEDAKMALLVRLGEAYLDRLDEKGAVDGALPVSLSPEKKVAAAKFEWGLGETLKNAYLHEEAVQVSDVPLMMRTASRSLHRWAKMAGEPKPDGVMDGSVLWVGNSLGYQALWWLRGFGLNLRKIDTDAFVRELVRSNAFCKALHFCAQAISRTENPSISRKDVIDALAALSNIVQSESWEAQQEDALDTGEPKIGALIQYLDDILLKPLCRIGNKEIDPPTRKALRSLRDMASAASKMEIPPFEPSS